MEVQELQKRLKNIKKLPACPRIIPQALKLSRNPETPMVAYEKLIAQDPALTADVLRSVNSPYYGLRNPVSSLRMALNIVGLQEIFRLILNASFHKTLHQAFHRLSYDFETFWKHSQMTANAAHVLARIYTPQFTGEAYIAGLLHDIGIPVMEEYFCEEWTRVVDLCEAGTDFLEAERQVFGVHHAEIGGLILSNWNIPANIVVPVNFHHRPLEASTHFDLVNTVYFADRLAIELMKDSYENVTQEVLEKDQIFEEMLHRDPRYRKLADEDFLTEIEPLISRKLLAVA